jgi:hypothetical protein
MVLIRKCLIVLQVIEKLRYFNIPRSHKNTLVCILAQRMHCKCLPLFHCKLYCLIILDRGLHQRTSAILEVYFLQCGDHNKLAGPAIAIAF